MISKLKLIVVLASMAIPQLAFSQETGWINVVQVGGQVSSMFVVFSQTVGTDQTCPNARLIIAPGAMDADSQKRFYAAMLNAMNTGAKVRLSVSGCYDSSYPTMLYYDYWFAANS